MDFPSVIFSCTLLRRIFLSTYFLIYGLSTYYIFQHQYFTFHWQVFSFTRNILLQSIYLFSRSILYSLIYFYLLVIFSFIISFHITVISIFRCSYSIFSHLWILQLLYFPVSYISLRNTSLLYLLRSLLSMDFINCYIFTLFVCLPDNCLFLYFLIDIEYYLSHLNLVLFNFIARLFSFFSYFIFAVDKFLFIMYIFFPFLHFQFFLLLPLCNDF